MARTKGIVPLEAARKVSEQRSQTPPKEPSETAPRQSKRPKLFDDSDSFSDDAAEFDEANETPSGAAGSGEGVEAKFKINEEFAKRFEHNKKREEMHKLEEKYGNLSASNKRKHANVENDEKYSDGSSSTSEDEDDDGFLATEALDAEIAATLHAIKSKDPRVYKAESKFYSAFDSEEEEEDKPKLEKPMYLRDYHRKNLLEGHAGSDKDNEEVDEKLPPPKTFAEEEAELKSSVVKEMHAAADINEDTDESAEDFLVRKDPPKTRNTQEENLKKVVKLNIQEADKDPDSFLSNFMAARAWVPTATSRFQPLESDDEEEDEKADAWEQAYNLRFENTSGNNEKLVSHARDTAAKFSVRREEENARKKARESQRAKREAEKRQIEAEKARLRNLKIDELRGKLDRIKDAAGLSGKTIDEEDWAKFLEEGWSDDKWEEEMNKRFGDDYYEEEEEADRGKDEEDSAHPNKHKIKKPKWDDNIDIKDIIPDFEDEEAETARPAFTLSDDENEGYYDEENGEEGHGESNPSTRAAKKSCIQDRQAAKRALRIERSKLEDIADSHVSSSIFPSSSKQTSRFRYRDTSPTSFGLTPADILLASDAQLNQFAGLKKMATFRDAEKKRKDKKRLGKKARLRMWRKETFGDEEGPGVGNIPRDDLQEGKLEKEVEMGGGGQGGKAKRRRTGKGKHREV
ncbi:MAG: KRRI-Interacting protein 1 [Trizodia sp. TS-e1964]|nr:MAG: KRRI-Interacting protein 1 [Trizodia sp. TS-e1964]